MFITLWDVKDLLLFAIDVWVGVPGVLVWSALWCGRWGRAPRMGPMSPVRADPHWAGLCPVKTDKSNQSTELIR